MHEFGTLAIDILTEDERLAVQTLKDGLGFDVFAQPLFWENVVAQQVGGSTTGHGELHDVDVRIWGRDCTAEVKFSRGFLCHFTRIRGKDWTRQIFKWAKPRGGSGKHSADAVVLIGLDQGLLFCWVVPINCISPNCASITMTTPLARSGKQSSPWDDFAVPFDAMLPSFARACHNRYDAPMRRAGIRERAFKAQQDMFK